MFLDQKLKNIQKEKDRLALCCDLRRHLIHVDVEGFFLGIRRTLTDVTLGVTIFQQILSYWHERKARR